MPARVRSLMPARSPAGIFALAAALWLGADQMASAQFAIGGVYVDAEGVLRQTSALAPDDRLKLLRADSIGATSLEPTRVSSLRKVSLRRLEEIVAATRAAGQPLPSEVRHLAGVTAVRYVFFDPEAGDVILAGPAEGWTMAETGEVVGERSGRPVLHLDDLIVALRFAFAENPTAGFIGCSIDPTAEGLQKHAAYMRRLGMIDRSRINQIFAGMEQAMGPHAVRLFGIDESSGAALTLVAADYRLKRLALGHDPSPVREVVNYLDLSARRFNRRAAQKQHRWWFVAHYDAVYHSADELAFELDGQGLKVVTARTFPGSAGAEGQSADEAPPSPAAVEFAESFTRHFPEIAEKLPVFRALQNLVGLATAAELIAQQQQIASETWRPSHFLDAEVCPVERFPVPKAVPSLANYRFIQGRHWMISISGGVEINPRELAGRRFRREADDRGLAELRTRETPPADVNRWWWD